MRLDLFLKASRLATRRTIAQQLCDTGRIRVNGQRAKSAKEINVGDELEIRRGESITLLKILAVPPTKQVSKADAESLFETISDERVGEELFSPGSL